MNSKHLQRIIIFMTCCSNIHYYYYSSGLITGLSKPADLKTFGCLIFLVAVDEKDGLCVPRMGPGCVLPVLSLCFFCHWCLVWKLSSWAPLWCVFPDVNKFTAEYLQSKRCLLSSNYIRWNIQKSNILVWFFFFPYRHESEDEFWEFREGKRQGFCFLNFFPRPLYFAVITLSLWGHHGWRHEDEDIEAFAHLWQLLWRQTQLRRQMLRATCKFWFTKQMRIQRYFWTWKWNLFSR